MQQVWKSNWWDKARRNKREIAQYVRPNHQFSFNQSERRKKWEECIILIFCCFFFGIWCPVCLCLCWNLHYVRFFDTFYCLPVSVITLFMQFISGAKKNNHRTSSIGMLFCTAVFRLLATWFYGECLDKLLWSGASLTSSSMPRNGKGTTLAAKCTSESVMTCDPNSLATLIITRPLLPYLEV